MAKKLSMPPEVRDTRTSVSRSRSTSKPVQPNARTRASKAGDITTPAPKEGETVTLSIKKAEGGHIVEQHTTDKLWRTKAERTRVVTGDLRIKVETESEQ